LAVSFGVKSVHTADKYNNTARVVKGVSWGNIWFSAEIIELSGLFGVEDLD